MANTTYVIPQSQQERFEEAIPLLFIHLATYRTLYNVDLVSIAKQGQNWNVILSNPLPADELKHIKMTL